MGWVEQLGKDNRGSRPRCVLLMDGSRDEVAKRLTRLVNLPGVVVAPDDKWMPYGKPVQQQYGSWDKSPVKEAKLGKPNNNALVCRGVHQQLQTWWLAVPQGANTPNWDIASTCRIKGKQGLLLVEAKAHVNELSSSGKSLPKKSASSRKNHKQIDRAIAEANCNLQSVTGNPWKISRDHYYQLSNRFAWSWKLVSLDIPVVLLYLGFLNAQDMAQDGRLFQSEVEWESTLKDYCDGVVDNTCWGKRLDFAGVPLLPLIRAFDQPFQP